MLRPNALSHVGILVADLDRTLNFYEALGLKLMRRKGPDAEGVLSAVVSAGNQELNLFCVPGLRPGEQENVRGMHHYCLDMHADSIDSVIADLRQAGVEIYRGPVERSDGTSVFVYDPDGVRVELWVARKAK